MTVGKINPIFFLLPFVIISLLLGIDAGLVRLGWSIPVVKTAMLHGGLMIGSFLGTLIIVERLVAMKIRWLWIFPVVNVASLPLFFTGKVEAAYIAMIIGSIGLVTVYILLIAKYKEFYFYVMLLGAVSWLVGNVFLFHSKFYPQAVPWWIGFILLTVGAERLELGKFLPNPPHKKPLFILAILIFITGCVMSFHWTGRFFMAAGLFSISIWLLNFDMIRFSIKKEGFHRYVGISLSIGYLWLIITAILLIMPEKSGFLYDATTHAFFLGFTFSMIFAHAPIIAPGITGLGFKPYHPSLYVWGILLFISLIVRIIADIQLWNEVRLYAGLMNMVAILGFFLNILVIVKTINGKQKED